MFVEPYAVEFDSAVVGGVASTGIVRGNYTNETIAPGERLLVVEIDSEDEQNELALVKSPTGYEKAILTEDAAPYFTPGEPLDKIRSMINLADATLANKLHPCMNGDIFGMGQMFTHENLSGFREAALNVDIIEPIQLQVALIANPLFEIAVGEDRCEELMELCSRHTELQSTYDFATDLWKELVDHYRNKDIIARYDGDTGTYDVFRSLYVGRVDDELGRTNHIGLCSQGAFLYEDDYSKPVNVAKTFVPYQTNENDTDAVELSSTVEFQADLGWVPEPELLSSTLGLETIAESISEVENVVHVTNFSELYI